MPHLVNSSIVAVLISSCFALSLSLGAEEAEKVVDLPDELRERYENLIAELRCPKCLNINIADSDAPIAKDLRKLVSSQLKEGKTDAEITKFMYDRYGDFILYDPPISATTLLLWVIPIVLILCAFVLLLRLKSRRQDIVLSDEQQQTLRALRQADKS